MSSFLDLVDAVGAYYGTGSDQWQIIAQGGINSPEALDIISQVPGVNVTVSNSGKILGYDFAKDFPNSTPASSAINSNTQTGAFNNSFNSNIPANAVPPSSEVPTGGMNSGAKLSGVGTTVATVADKISLAMAGVALGTKLGKLIDSGIYAFNPTWFDEHFPTINPETWDDMATTEGGKQFIRTIFGLQNDEATMYLDERLLAQTYMMLLANGAYGGGGGSSATIEDTSPLLGGEPYPIPTYFEISDTINANTSATETFRKCVVTQSSAPVYALRAETVNGGNQLILISEQSFRCDYWNNSQNPRNIGNDGNFTNNGLSVYFTYLGIGDSPLTTPYAPPVDSTPCPYFSNNLYWNMLYIIKNGTITTGGELDGVSNNPNATLYIDPSQITGTDLNTVLQQLKTLYPDLFNGSIYIDVPQNDGTIEHYTYIPVPYPNTSTPTQPVSDNTPNVNPQTNPQVNPDNRPNSAQNIADTVTSPTNNSPDTGDGNTPPVVPPTGGASSLWAVYNPTQAQVDDFGAWLWSSNFVEQIKKLFADPMQGIIGLHKIFATPSTGAAQNIKVGYLDSGVPSAVVTSQYTDIDCGEVNVSEYFGNVFDYEDTTIRLYLPFIGIVDLSTSDVMRGSVRVVYHVDVITGACLADVIVSRDSAGGVLYQYSGDAAVRYPVSSGSYMGMVSGVLAVVGGVVGIASGGAALPAVMGAASGVMNSRTSVKHSGNFSGAAGAMGAKIPYLIIERPQSAVANDYANYQGIGDNRVINVGSMHGYFKMTDVHTNGVLHATAEEIEQIKGLLEGGVIQ